ncbi:hypothetical protein D3C80_1763000 [compost metagenome]
MTLADIQPANLAHTFFAHHGQVYGSAQRQQRLVGANVRGRFFAADMLLAGLQGQYEAAFAVTVNRLADDPARHAAHQRLCYCEETAGWTAE